MSFQTPQGPIRQVMSLWLVAIMITTLLPAPAMVHGEPVTEYTTIVLTGDMAYLPGDNVTIHIHFYQGSTPTDPDEITVSLGDPGGGTGRYVEVNESSSRVSEGVFRVTFPVTGEDDQQGRGLIHGEVRCTVGTGGDAPGASHPFILRLGQEQEEGLAVRVTADSPVFGDSGTVHFRAAFTYNGTPVDPGNLSASLTENGVEGAVNLTRQEPGIYGYGYPVPDDGESKHLVLTVSGSHNGSRATGEGMANRDYLQVWLHTGTFAPDRMEGQIGVCDMNGTPEEIPVSLICRYDNGSQGGVVDRIDGTTGSGGLLNITLEYGDLVPGGSLDIIIRANGSSRGGRDQYARTTVRPPPGALSGDGFRVVMHHDDPFLREDTEYSLRYTALMDGSPLAGTEIFHYYYEYHSLQDVSCDPEYDADPSLPWFSCMGSGDRGDTGEVFHAGSVVTDENGTFIVTWTTPARPAAVRDLFKVDLGGSGEGARRGDGDEGRNESRDGDRDSVRGGDGDGDRDSARGGNGDGDRDSARGGNGDGNHTWAEASVTTLFVGSSLPGFHHLGMAWDHFGPGEQTRFTLSREGLDGGRGGIHLHVFDPGRVSGNILGPGNRHEINRWIFLNRYHHRAGPLFTGENLTVDTGIPGFFPAGLHYLLVGFILSHNGAGEETLQVDHRVLDAHGNDITIPRRQLSVETDAPDSVDSGEGVDITVTVTGSPPVEGARITVSATGPASVHPASGFTNGTGRFTFSLEADEISEEDDPVTLRITASAEGYADGVLDLTMVVKAPEPLRDMVVTSSLPDRMRSEQLIPMAISARDGGDPLQGVSVTIRVVGPAQACKASGTTDEDGRINCNLRILNVTGEDTTVTVYFNGTRDGYHRGTFVKVITVEAWIEPRPLRTMNITTNLPNVMSSEQILVLYITVTHDEEPLAGVALTLQINGPGRTCKPSGITDAQGKVGCAITILKVTGADDLVVLYINGTMDGYHDAFYRLNITILGEIPPDPVHVIGPFRVDLGNGTTAEVTAGVRGNLTLDVTGAPDPRPGGSGSENPWSIFLRIATAGYGTLEWAAIGITYDVLPQGVDPTRLALFSWHVAGERWVRVANSGSDVPGLSIRANVTRAGVFAPMEDHGDTEPPRITHTPVSSAQPGDTVRIRAVITDVGNGVQEARLYFRRTGEPGYSSVIMIRIGESYEAIIPSERMSGPGVEYYIEATDGTTIVTHPADVVSPHAITIGKEGKEKEKDSPGFGLPLLMVAGAMGLSMARRRKVR